MDSDPASQSNFTYIQCSIQNANELNIRLAKLQQILNETLWRFQIVKSDLVLMDYGRVNHLFAENHHTAKSINDRQQNMIYELMKERKRRRSSASIGGMTMSVIVPSSVPSHANFGDNLNQVSLTRNESKASLIKQRTFTNTTTNMFDANYGKLHANSHHRSHESQRSLSLIYPLNKNKRSNLTVMKLLANVETLSTLCLKEEKLSEANQLVKMYASKKEACKSFEFREIIFYTVYQKTIDELNKFNKLQQKQAGSELSVKKRQNLIDLSMQSLDMAKITENLLSFVEKDDEFLKCIFLCDTITIANVDLKVASNLIDYARIKLNQNLIASSANNDVTTKSKDDNEDEKTTSSKTSKDAAYSSDSDENFKKSSAKLKRKNRMKSIIFCTLYVMFFFTSNRIRGA